MTGFRRRLAALIAAALLTAGCGGGASDTSVTTIGVLGAALADTADASTYRVSISSNQIFRVPALGIDSSAESDNQAPTLISEVGPNRVHLVMSFGESPGSDTTGIGSIQLEMWVDREVVVIDTRDYQRLSDEAPGIELGPLEPGLFFVNIAELGIDDSELQNAISGSSAPDLKELAEQLPQALNAIEQTSTNPPIFAGSTTSADLMEAQGANVEDISRSIAAGMSLVFPVGVDEITNLFVELYETAPAEVVIELDDRGLLSVLWTRQDLSGFFDAFVEAEDLLPGITDQERDELTESFGDAEFILETRSVYEAGIGIEVPLPPATTEDRTEEWREFLENAGFGN